MEALDIILKPNGKGELCICKRREKGVQDRDLILNKSKKNYRSADVTSAQRLTSQVSWVTIETKYLLLY